MDELAALTGWHPSRYTRYVNEYDRYLKKPDKKEKIDKGYFDPTLKMNNDDGPTGISGVFLTAIAAVLLLIIVYTTAYQWQVLRRSSVV